MSQVVYDPHIDSKHLSRPTPPTGLSSSVYVSPTPVRPSVYLSVFRVDSSFFFSPFLLLLCLIHTTPRLVSPVRGNVWSLKLNNPPGCLYHFTLRRRSRGNPIVLSSSYSRPVECSNSLNSLILCLSPSLNPKKRSQRSSYL